MNAREFFYKVAEMRDAQQRYFETRDQKLLQVCKALERQIDIEIKRVKALGY